MHISQRASRWLKFLAALAISVFFSVLFIRSIDLGEAADALASADYLYVVPALALFGLSLVARAVRWHWLYRPQRDISARTLLSPLLIGYAGDNLLPLRAGQILRAQVTMDRLEVPRMVSFGTFIMERLFDFLILSVILLWGLLLAGAGKAYLGAGLVLFVGSIVGFALGVFVARNPGIPGRLVSHRVPLLPDWVRAEVISLGDSFFSGFSVLTSLRATAVAAVTSALAWGLELSMYWVISQGFGLSADFITIAFAGAAANVAMSIPSAQGGVGPFQLLALKALQEFGVAESAAAAYAVALHIFLVGPVSLVGLLVLWRSAVPLSPREPQPETALAATPADPE